MTRKITFTALALVCSVALGARTYSVKSPSGTLEMTIGIADRMTWSLTADGKKVSADNEIAMSLKGGRTLGHKAAVTSVKRGKISRTIPSPFYRQAQIEDNCNTLTLKMKDGWALEARAYDEGVAYRFVTSMRDSLTILDETVRYRHNGDLVIPLIKLDKGKWASSFEAEYTFCKDGDEVLDGKTSFLPILSTPCGDCGRILLLEADLEDYPGMFIRPGEHVLSALFPPVPSRYDRTRRWSDKAVEFEDYIARTAGGRTFPWRIIAWSKDDTGLPVNNLVYALGSPCRVKDTGWIRAGLSTWDWWNDFRLYNVDFTSGVNTQTHKYHIDFAAKYGIPYITVDEGWYKCPDIFNPIPEMDIAELCRYGKEKGVGVILWCTAGLIDLDVEKAFSHFEAMGVAGFKLDFMDSQDQKMVHKLYRIAESAARHHLVIDFHGMYKPTGFSRTYPNVLNYEGVFGLEQIGRKGLDMPRNDVTIPFIRMAAGPMDYTSGAMQTAARKENAAFGRTAYAQGTKAHQVATFIVFDQPLGMMCDSPSRYLDDTVTTSFITAIPTVFDRTFIQSGQVGRNIVTVRNAGDKWFVGGLTCWDEYDAEVDFSFLPEGQWRLRFYHDGPNSHRTGIDYRCDDICLDSSSKITVHMAPGGGFGMILTRQ